MQLNLEQPIRNSHYLHRKSNWENATNDPHQKKKKKKEKIKSKEKKKEKNYVKMYIMGTYLNTLINMSFQTFLL